ncbi:MAG: peptidase M48 Ste24p [Candidatus Electrothrix sp. LOE1_4_5]|nr:peptidase M48 Ste24p [Candidatus Electrothrix gigas]
MIYNNIIYFLAVIFAVSTAATPEQPWLAPWLGLPLFILLLLTFSLLVKKLFGLSYFSSSQRYFAAEKKATLLATVLFIASFFIFDIKYYAQPLSLRNTLPTGANLLGLLVFFGFLVLMWLQAWPSYQRVFHSSIPRRDFVINNITTNLTIVLPWLILSLLFDLLEHLSVSGMLAMDNWLQGPWRELFFFLIFLVLLGGFFPPLVHRLWGCVPMEQGPLRQSIERFFQSQNFSAKILYWPLFEGRMITAGVMGIVPRYRYLLLTPALLSALDQEELEAVLAHEIGHVKRYHLILYLLLFLGFSLFAEALSTPLYLLLSSHDWLYQLVNWLQISPDKLLTSAVAVSLFVLMLLYFRFLFGYFIRNFERQADLYVFQAQNTAFPLIRSFEKIAAMSGNIRDKKNWHHFGIGERIDFLEQCENNRKSIQLHHWKVYGSLVVYCLLLSAGLWSLHHLDTTQLSKRSENRYMQAMLTERIRQEPENSQLLKLFGDVMLQNKKERAALHAYERAIQVAPLTLSPELANNLAWLLLTAKDHSLRDPVRALELASSAAHLSEKNKKGYILDTLATALWANNRVQEAVAVEEQAAALDPDNFSSYQKRRDTFQQEAWEAFDFEIWP